MIIHHRRVATTAFMFLFMTSSLIAMTTTADIGTAGSLGASHQDVTALSQSMINASVPYVDFHYGSADGIIDPTEYGYSYTDPATGIKVYLEHNSTIMYVGLSAPTGGWTAIGWQFPNGTFTTAGLNNSDLIFGYAPGTPYASYARATGAEVVTVHYKLYLRNGTLYQQGYAPSNTSTTALNNENLLSAYKAAIIGMRIGEVKHFIIPANNAYTKPSDTLYGEDLEYVITLTRIGSSQVNPASSSAVVYSDQRGVSTFAHVADSDQSRIVAANASGTATSTHIEYLVRMNSTDANDISLLNSTELHYPMIVMFGNGEDISSLPVQHTDWSYPIMMQFDPNTVPAITITSPAEDAAVRWVIDLKANITDNTIVRRAFCRIDDENWTVLHYDSANGLWTIRIDVTNRDAGTYAMDVNATDGSDKTNLLSFNVTLELVPSPLRGMQLSVSRTVYTMPYHALKTGDEFTVTNNGSSPIGAIEYYLPKTYGPKFLSISAQDSSSNDLGLVRLDDHNGMMHWRISFSQPVGYMESYKFTVTVHLHSTQVLTNYTTYIFDVITPRYPLVPYLMTRASLALNFRSGDTLQGTSPEGTRTNIAPMTYEEAVVTMKSYTPVIVASRITNIVIDPWGWLAYEETIYLENNGPSRENTITMTFPEYTTNIRIYDQVGILTDSMPDARDWNETLTQTINLKTDRFGDNGFMPDYKYTFTVTYVVQLTSCERPGAAGTTIDFPIATLGDLPVLTHTVDVRVPVTVNVVDVSGDYRLLYGVFDSTLRFTGYNMSAQNPIQLSITYTLSLGTVARPMLFSLLIGLIAAMYVAWRKSPVAISETQPEQEEGVPSTKQVGAPVELLSSFASTYSKKTALELDLEKLEASVGRGKVTRKEFMIRDRDMKSQLEELGSKLVKLREELISYGTKYRDIVAQLEMQDERVAGAKAGLTQLIQRRKTQKISRAAYEKSRQDYLKTIKQAYTTTDRILLSLQEEAGEI